MQRVGGRCRCLHIAASGQLTAGDWRAGPCLLSGHCSTLALAWPPNFIVVISCGTNCGPGCVQCPYFVLVILQCECYSLTSCGVSSGKGTEQERREIFVCDLSERQRGQEGVFLEEFNKTIVPLSIKQFQSSVLPLLEDERQGG